jgi:hypothetical protein
MLVLGACVFGVTVFLYLKAWDALGAWANHTIPPNMATEFVTVTKAACFLFMPGMALVLVGCALTILRASAAAAGSGAVADELSQPSPDPMTPETVKGS